MTRSFRIGRIFGIDIEIDYTWFIIFTIVVVGLSLGWFAKLLPNVSPGIRWAVGVLTALLFFGSVLVHELSHSVIALRNDLNISGITLFLFGGVSKMTDEPKSAGVEFKMAVAGPLTSLILAGVFIGLSVWLLPARTTPGLVLGTVFRWLGYVNGMLGIFNLLPGFPLDGGRVLRSALWGSMHDLRRATRIASSFGEGIGVLMIVGGVFLFFTGVGFSGIWLAFIGWFLVQAAQQSYQQMVLKQTLSGVSVSQMMTTDVDVVDAYQTLDQVADHVMTRHHPAFPVEHDGQLLGLICLQDLRSVPRENWNSVTAAQAAPPISDHNTISPSADAWDALIRMSQESCGRLMVVKDGLLQGIISRTDIMRAMRHRLQLGM
jgi:Zn-dependent protease/predicted transcriptional regulator